MAMPFQHPAMMQRPQPGMAQTPGIAPPTQMPQGVPPGAGMGGAMGAQGIDPATIEAMLSMQQAQGDQAGIDRQFLLANKLRKDAPDMMRGAYSRNVGNVPNYLGTMAAVMASRKADRMEEDAALRSQNLGTQRSATARKFFDEITGRKAAPVVPGGDEGE